jgi:hypothetical protein
MVAGFDYRAKPRKRRPCARCGKNRSPNFFTGPRGRVCTVCQKKRKSSQSRGDRIQDQYGITLGEYGDLFKAQGGKCAICGGTRRQNLDVDHDHKVEKASGNTRVSVRGLLCRRCNRRLLPACLDDPEVLRRAIAYLESPPARQVIR